MMAGLRLWWVGMWAVPSPSMKDVAKKAEDTAKRASIALDQLNACVKADSGEAVADGVLKELQQGSASR